MTLYILWPFTLKTNSNFINFNISTELPIEKESHYQFLKNFSQTMIFLWKKNVNLADCLKFDYLFCLSNGILQSLPFFRAGKVGTKAVRMGKTLVSVLLSAISRALRKRAWERKRLQTDEKSSITHNAKGILAIRVNPSVHS